MCDYQRLIATPDGSPVQTDYCNRAPAFWVQSLTSTHNMHACAQHLVRIVRSIEEAAEQYDVCHPNYIGKENVQPCYVRPVRMITVNGKSRAVSESVARESANYARVTVKPHARKAR